MKKKFRNAIIKDIFVLLFCITMGIILIISGIYKFNEKWQLFIIAFGVLYIAIIFSLAFMNMISDIWFWNKIKKIKDGRN